MKRTFLAVAALSAVLAGAVTHVNAQAGDGWLSRYWDGCKPSCSWSGKQYNGQGQCKECDKNNNKMNTSDANRSSCDGGNAYTCWDMAPWAISTTEAYGFAAAHRDQQCGTCWKLTFNGQSNGNATNAASLNGKVLTVMISNIGGDVAGNQLDFLVPGGGVGAFDAFSSQIGVQKSALGAQYGGLVSDGCMGNPSCLKTKCANVFNGKDWLKAGCDFYADWMGAVDNPKYKAESVTCPAALVDRWKNAATGNPPVNPPTNPTTYTLTVNSNPTAGGTATAGSTSGIAAGTQVNITAAAASGYTFNNWTISGSGTIANASNASTTVTVNGNVTVTANFTQNPSTYTLTVERNPTAGGTTTPTSSQSNINPGTQVNISATPASGYTFTNWTITSGSGTIAGANNASTSITVNGNVTVRANFTQNQSQYTLTINRNPTAGGTVKVGANDYSAPVTVTGGASTAISATAASGYTFTNWTVTSGSAQINNANSASTNVTLNGNATITANFTQNPTTPTTYTLTVSRLPDNGAGTVKVNSADYSAPVSVDGGTAVNVVATPASGYKFASWTVATGTASIASGNDATTTVTLTSNATITANFTPTTVTPPAGGGGDTIKVEAENYKTFDGSGMQLGSVEGGGTCIGYIENGYSATYDVNAPKSDNYVLEFKIATGNERSSFTVQVNGQNVGTISTNNTGGWDTYVTWAISSKVALNAGDNTVVLRFDNAVNVDYFLVISDKKSDPPPNAVKHNAAKSIAARTQVALRSAARGFTASLAAGHGFTSYSVIDLQGREVRSGKIGASTTDLRVGNLKHSVVFLRLFGGAGQAPLSLKVVTY